MFSFFLIGPLQALIVTTQNNEEIEAVDFEELPSELKLRMQSGEIRTIAKASIKKVSYYFEEPRALSSYPILGGTFGSPGILNLNLGYVHKKYGISLSGSYLGTVYGLQANISKVLHDTRTFMHAIFVGAGYLSLTTKEQGGQIAHRFTYGAFGYHLNWWGFFLELGLGFGSGDYTNPQFLGQIGYVHRFNVQY